MLTKNVFRLKLWIFVKILEISKWKIVHFLKSFWKLHTVPNTCTVHPNDTTTNIFRTCWGGELWFSKICCHSSLKECTNENNLYTRSYTRRTNWRIFKKLVKIFFLSLNAIYSFVIIEQTFDLSLTIIPFGPWLMEHDFHSIYS